MKSILFLLGILPVMLCAQAEDQRFITVRGEAQQSIEPDLIELSIVFSETENIRRENELQLKEEALKRKLHQFSIGLENLTIDNLAARRYGYYKTTSNKVRVSKVFKLRVKQAARVDSLVLELFKIGANDVSVTNLQSYKLEQTQLELTVQAFEKAKRKAECIAQQAGVRIGNILEIQEYHPEEPQIPSKGRSSLYSKMVSANGTGQYSNQEDNNFGIRKIKIAYALDVKFELK